MKGFTINQTVWPNQSIERRFQLVNISFLLDSFEKAQGTPEERHFHKAPSDFSYHVKRHTLNKSTENHKEKHIRIILSKAFFPKRSLSCFKERHFQVGFTIRTINRVARLR